MRNCRISAWQVVALITVSALRANAQGSAERSSEAADARDEKTEFTPVPLAGGSTDIGFGGGVLASLSRHRPGSEPHLYRIELASLSTFRKSGEGVETPFQDHYLLVDLPRLGRGFELKVRASYTREATLKYYGVGNATRLDPGLELQSDYYEYDRIHPKFEVQTRQFLAEHIALELRLAYIHNLMEVRPGTKLFEDLSSDNRTVRDLVASATEDHGVMTFGYGVAFDSRDNETAPRSGHYHNARFDWSPGGSANFPYRFARTNVSMRWFVPIEVLRTTLALRALGDVLFGDPPVYELARFDDTSALGGSKGVRGVPAQRYHGMIKALGNVELRTRLFSFDFLGKENTLATAAFVDFGRVWASYGDHPELDGDALGLKYGLGGGPRLLAGKSFVLRVDVGWSRDAEPITAYFESGHVF